LATNDPFFINKLKNIVSEENLEDTREADDEELNESVDLPSDLSTVKGYLIDDFVSNDPPEQGFNLILIKKVSVQ